MPATNIDNEILAQHLEVAGKEYLKNAQTAREIPDAHLLAQQFDLQAKQCTDWANALRGATNITLADGDAFIVIHD